MELTLEQVRAYCVREKVRVRVEDDGTLLHGIASEMPAAIAQKTLCELVADSEGLRGSQREDGMPAPFRVPGYEELATVLLRAFEQAAKGKGKERHANGEPFTHQVMQDGARRFGVGSLLFQAYKKSEESQRLPLDRAVAELLGAIVYTAGAVIALERKANPPQEVTFTPAFPANDNTPRCCSDSSKPQNAARCAGCAESNTFGGSATRRA